MKSAGLKWFRQQGWSTWPTGRKSAKLTSIPQADLLYEIKLRKAASRFGAFSRYETERLQKQLNELTLEAARREIPELERL